MKVSLTHSPDVKLSGSVDKALHFYLGDLGSNPTLTSIQLYIQQGVSNVDPNCKSYNGAVVNAGYLQIKLQLWPLFKYHFLLNITQRYS